MKLLALSLLLTFAACSASPAVVPADAAIPADAASAPDLAPAPDLFTCPVLPDGGAAHALAVNIALTDDGQGVPLFAQNGATVHVPSASIAGKSYYYATTHGGDQVANETPIDIGVGTIAADLTASFHTPDHYPDGPWEMALFISIVGADPTLGPQPGDLAGFSLATPPACDPPVTGVSVRMDVNGADATATFTNMYFIRFGK